MRDFISIIIDHICKNKSNFATCIDYFLTFDQSGLTTAVWQLIFQILLRIGSKSDVIDDIENYMKSVDIT